MSRDCVSIVWVCTCVGVFHMCKTAVLKYTLCSSRQATSAKPQARRKYTAQSRQRKSKARNATLPHTNTWFRRKSAHVSRAPYFTAVRTGVRPGARAVYVQRTRSVRAAAPALRARGAGCAGSSTAVKITAGTPQPKNKKTYFSQLRLPQSIYRA